MMRMIQSTGALVLSRMRFDWKRHLVALAAVAVLMASFLTFNAVADGMQDGLRNTLAEGDHNQVQITLGGLAGGSGMDADAYEGLAAHDSVVRASQRSAKSINLSVPGPEGSPIGGPTRNISFEILMLGIDAEVEEALVVSGTPGAAVPAPFTRGGFQARNYTLLEGTWIQAPYEAVATQSAAEAGYGIGSQIVTAEGDYTVVGVVANSPPLTVPGVIPAGHILVDRADQEWGAIGGAYFELEPDFAAIQTFADRLISEYPAATGALRADMAALERQHFEEARTQEVLAAAGRLVGLAGAATVFAMSLFLLIGERKAIGTMAAVGFTRARLASYMNQKMVLLAAVGAASGAALGWLVVGLVPMPNVSFEFAARIDAPTLGWTLGQTLAAALAGSLLAFLLTIRQDPMQALRSTE